MPLAEYLASEQAREEVARMVAAPSGIIKAHRIDGGFLARGWKDAGVWSQIGVIRGDFERSVIVSAYCCPDGDRYVVTDLGEGVRALRLRTGWIHGRANGHAMQERETLASGGVGWVAGMSGDIELDGVKADQLPDALCRVMLASLRVAHS